MFYRMDSFTEAPAYGEGQLCLKNSIDMTLITIKETTVKKKAIALGVLAVLAGTAAAQSNLTLYGKIDVGYGVSNGGKAEGAPGHEGKFQQWGGRQKYFPLGY